jgi:hypothetical protein
MESDTTNTTSRIGGLDDIHVIAREILALREIVEMKPHPEILGKVRELQFIATRAQSAAMSIQGSSEALSRRVAELENELAKISDKNAITHQYSTPLEELEMCDPLSKEDYLLVFRDTTGSRVTVQLRSAAIPDLVQKLNSCR